MEIGGVALSRAEQVAPHCDVIIQATPVGMKPGDPPLLPATAFRNVANNAWRQQVNRNATKPFDYRGFFRKLPVRVMTGG